MTRIFCGSEFFRELADIAGMIKALHILRENPQAVRVYVDSILHVACDVLKHMGLCPDAEHLADLAYEYDVIIREHTRCSPLHECKTDWKAVRRDPRFKDLLMNVESTVNAMLDVIPEALIAWASRVCRADES